MAKKRYSAFPKAPAYRSLTIRLFSVIYRTLVKRGLLPYCRDAVGVLQPQPTRQTSNYYYNKIHRFIRTSIYILVVILTKFQCCNPTIFRSLSWFFSVTFGNGNEGVLHTPGSSRNSLSFFLLSHSRNHPVLSFFISFFLFTHPHNHSPPFFLSFF